jgi:hypothetical protein
MRTPILDYLKANKKHLAPLMISDNLPWEDNGGALYHHNKKHIYVDTPQTSQTPIADALNGAGYVDEVTTVSVYFVSDAKQPLSNYDALCEIIKGARTGIDTTGYIQKLVQVSSNYNVDALVTQFDFSFRKLLTN